MKKEDSEDTPAASTKAPHAAVGDNTAYASPESTPYCNVSSLAELRKVERQQRLKGQNELVSKLDSLLPRPYCRQATSNGAGPRALGSKGRSLHDVLEDARAYLITASLPATTTSLRRRVPMQAVDVGEDQGKGKATRLQDLAQRQPAAASHALDTDAAMRDRDGLLSSPGLLCLELQMPGWKIRRMGVGAASFLQFAPWGNSIGQSFANALVHTQDIALLSSMWEQMQEQLRPLGGAGCKRQRSGDDAWGVSRNVRVRMYHFCQVSGLEEGAEPRPLRVCKSVWFDIQLIAPPLAASQAAGGHVLLVVASFASAERARAGPSQQQAPSPVPAPIPLQLVSQDPDASARSARVQVCVCVCVDVVVHVCMCACVCVCVCVHACQMPRPGPLACSACVCENCSM